MSKKGGESPVPQEFEVRVVKASGEQVCSFQGISGDCIGRNIYERVSQTTSCDTFRIALCSSGGAVIKDDTTISTLLDQTSCESCLTLTLVALKPYLVLGDPKKCVARALKLMRSWVTDVMDNNEPGIESLSGNDVMVDSLFMPPNCYKGARDPWSLDDVDVWLLLLPRPGTVQGDLLAVFRLRDGRHVYIRALSDYYSGDWAGINIRVYMALDLESLERYGMGFCLADIEHCVPDGIDSPTSNQQLALQAWMAVMHAVGDTEKWLVCNNDAHSCRRGNQPNFVSGSEEENVEEEAEEEKAGGGAGKT